MNCRVMERRKLFVSLAVLLAASLLAAIPAGAKSTKEEVDIFELACLETPGMTWTTGKDGQILHIRGQVALSVFYNSASLEVVGGNTIIGNADLNQATGKGAYYGTFSGLYLPASAASTFDGHWTLNGNTGVFSGHAVGNGTGELEGEKMMVKLSGLSDLEAASLLEQLVALGRLFCPPELIVGITRDTGYVLDPHGE